MQHRNADSKQVEHDLKHIDEHHDERRMARYDAASAYQYDDHLDRGEQVCRGVDGDKAAGDETRDEQHEEHHSRDHGKNAQQDRVFLANDREQVVIRFLFQACVEEQLPQLVNHFHFRLILHFDYFSLSLHVDFLLCQSLRNHGRGDPELFFQCGTVSGTAHPPFARCLRHLTIL